MSSTAGVSAAGASNTIALVQILVLVVSEDPATADWVRKALGPACSIEHAVDGRAALRRVEEDFDLVIADETTGSYGAFGLARELKFSPDAPAVIVLLERAQDAWLAKWSGADRWLLRPIDPFELAAVAAELTSAGAAAPRAGAIRGRAPTTIVAEPGEAAPDEPARGAQAEGEATQPV